jgi:hypothetical protein
VWWVAETGLVLDLRVMQTATKYTTLPDESTITVVGELWDHNPDEHVYMLITAAGQFQTTRRQFELLIKEGLIVPYKLNYAASPAR